MTQRNATQANAANAANVSSDSMPPETFSQLDDRSGQQGLAGRANTARRRHPLRVWRFMRWAPVAKSGLRSPLLWLLILPTLIVFSVFAAAVAWLMRDLTADHHAALGVLLVLAGAAFIAMGGLVHSALATWLDRMTVAVHHIADRPKDAAGDESIGVLPLDHSPPIPPSLLPTTRQDPIGRLARAMDAASHEVRAVMNAADGHNDTLFEAKQALEGRLTELAREVGDARVYARRTAQEVARSSRQLGQVEARARRLEQLIEQSGDAIIALDQNGSIEFVNLAFERLTGYRGDEVLGANFDVLRLGAASGEIEAALDSARKGRVYRGVLEARANDGRMFYADLTLSPLSEAGQGGDGLVATLRDATERVRKEAEIHYLAKYDALTRMPNRVSLLEHLQALVRAGRSDPARGLRAAVLYIDLDRFKPINDRYGHHVGDRVLTEIATRFRNQVRAEDIVARVGGDEFVAILSGVADAEGGIRAGRKLIESLRGPFMVGEQPIEVTASIGVALYPDHSVDAFHLIRLADAAMYAAKEQGGSVALAYRPGTRFDSRLNLVREAG